ncbi:MAG: cytochrome d ubiquinol oxidase subunit II [Elusimicrobiota bacterium]
MMGLDLNLVWFLLVGVLFTGYVMLDGFDLGVGALHLFTKSDKERRIMLNAIGPVWDGNEVWLVTGGGALFAAFPEAYATVFSGFYTAFMLLLASLIFRAVSIEVRGKQPMAWWKSAWDVGFSSSSVLSSFLIGVAMGNLAWGIPLTAGRHYAAGFWALLHPYSILMGVTAVALFMMHGAIFMLIKTEGAFQTKIREWVRNAIIFFVLCYVLVTMATLLYLPHMSALIVEYPALFLLPALNVLAIANIPREIFHQRELRAFFSSCAAMAVLMALLGIGMFPNLVYSNPYPELSLTIYNAASSQKTLGIMLIIALIGMPLVLSYTVGIYWLFRGKVKLDSTSY